jgi:hypothetical protein
MFTGRIPGQAGIQLIIDLPKKVGKSQDSPRFQNIILYPRFLGIGIISPDFQG